MSSFNTLYSIELVQKNQGSKCFEIKNKIFALYHAKKLSPLQRIPSDFGYT